MFVNEFAKKSGFLQGSVAVGHIVILVSFLEGNVQKKINRWVFFYGFSKKPDVKSYLRLVIKRGSFIQFGSVLVQYSKN